MVWVDAARSTVAGVLRDTAFLEEVLGAAGHRPGLVPGRWLCAADTASVRVRVLPGIRLPVRVAVRAAQADEISVQVLSRPLAGLRLDMTLRGQGTGTAVHDELHGHPPGLVARLLLRRLHRDAPDLRAARAELLVAWAAEVAARRVVVATALVRDGAVLAAQRTRPPALAGRWELPGGRVEPGESEDDAVVRECREELGCAVTPTGRVGTDLLIDAGVLRVHAATAPTGSVPRALEHADLRWVTAAELEALDWVAADRAVLPDLRALLGSRSAVAG